MAANTTLLVFAVQNDQVPIRVVLSADHGPERYRMIGVHRGASRDDIAAAVSLLMQGVCEGGWRLQITVDEVEEQKEASVSSAEAPLQEAVVGPPGFKTQSSNKTKVQVPLLDCSEACLAKVQEGGQALYVQLNHKDLASIQAVGGHYERSQSQWTPQKPQTEQVPVKAVTVESCLQDFFAEEVLSEGNEITCDSCDAKSLPTKRLRCTQLPQVLVLHLNRLRVFGLYDEKIDTPVVLPSNLDLAALDSVEGEVGESNYELVAMSNHIGDSRGGHYTADVRLEDGWWHFDDAWASKSDNVVEESWESKTAYLVVYRRKGSSWWQSLDQERMSGQASRVRLSA